MPSIQAYVQARDDSPEDMAAHAADLAHAAALSVQRSRARGQGSLGDIAMYLGLGAGQPNHGHPAGELADMARANQTQQAQLLRRQRRDSTPNSSVHSSGDPFGVASAGRREGEAGRPRAAMDALRMRRTAGSLPPAAPAVEMHEDSEATFWNADTRFEDDDVVWARRHGEEQPRPRAGPSPADGLRAGSDEPTPRSMDVDVDVVYR